MDNKITKSRLANFFAYEWILMLVSIIIAVVVMELVFAMAGVRLSVGQTFSIYYDENIVSTNQDGFESMLTDNETFSYDVLEVTQEALLAEQNVLYLRMSTYDADAIITDEKLIESEGYEATRGKSLIDVYDMYVMDELYEDACNYLKGFLKEEGLDPTNYANLKEDKIDEHFLIRLSKDNRFRSSAKKEEGKSLERARIKKLCLEVQAFKKLLDLDTELYQSSNGEQSYFTYYTKGYQQMTLVAEGETEELAEKTAIFETAKADNLAKYGRETARYGLKADMLKDGTRSVNEFFRIVGGTDATDVVIEIFNFRAQQIELQYESISFLTTIVKNCSNLNIYA